MSLDILFHLLCAQHVSDINISLFRSLRLCWWITTSVVLFCKDGWFSVSVNLRCIVVCVWCDVFCRLVVVGRRTLIDIDRYLLRFVIIVFVCVWYFSLVVWYLVPTPTNYNKATKHITPKFTTTHRKVSLMLKHPSLQNKTTDVVIQQHSRKLLMMEILMSEICWAHKKWNKIASDIKLVFHSTTIMNIWARQTEWISKQM